MIWFLPVASALVVDSSTDLQAILDTNTDELVLEMESGVYAQPLSVRGGTVTFRPNRGASVVLGGIGTTGDAAQLTVGEGASVLLEGIAVVPTNRTAIRLLGGKLSVADVQLEVLGAGRLIDAEVGEVSITTSSLTGGTADRGGQLRIGALASATVQQSVFTDAVGRLGGAVYVQGELLAVDAQFLGNEAVLGGAVYCSGTCTLTGGSISDNHAEASGGGLFADPGATVTLEDVDLFRNRATDGGGVFASSAVVDIQRSSLCRNRALGTADVPGRGGGLYVDGPDTTLAFDRLLLNDAGRGGGVYITSPEPAVALHLSLVGNSALEGGAVYGNVELRRALIGHHEGGVVLVPKPGEEIRALVSRMFLNTPLIHPTFDFDDRDEPQLRSFALSTPCEQVDDRFRAGSESVVAAAGREAEGGRPLEEYGAYGTVDGIPTGDEDRDGFDAVYDCNDRDPTTFPSIVVVDVSYDGIDSNCDGRSDFDFDADGFDSVEHGGLDCDDKRDDVFPGAPDLDPTVDGNCNGFTEEFAPTLKSAGCQAGGRWSTSVLRWLSRRR